MRQKFKSTLILVSGFFLVLTSELASASPPTFAYQGRIVGANGQGLEYASVSFEFTVTSPDGTCVLYKEQRNGLDMRNSKGIFETPIGSGTKSYPAAPSFTLLDAFNNSGALACDGGATYTPAFDDGRRLRVQFFDGAGWRLITPDSIIRSVPYAAFSSSAAKLGGKTANEFVLKTSLPAACGANEVLTYDGTGFTCVADQGGAGTITSVAGSGPIVVTGTGNVTVSATTGTTAGTLAAGDDARFTDSRNPSGAAGGDLSGTYPNPSIAANAVTTTKILNSAVTSAKIQDATITAADLAAGSATGQVFRFDGTAWQHSKLVYTDLVNSNGVSPWPTGTCVAGQFITWVSVVDGFACSNISSSAITTALGFTPARASRSIIAGTGLTGGGDLSADRTLAVDVGTGANQIPQLDGSGKLPSSVIPVGADGTWSLSSGNVYRSSGNVGIGTTSPSGLLHLVSEGSTLDQILTVYNNTTIPSIKLQKARTSLATPTIVQDGDTLLRINGEGYDGSTFRSAGYVRVNVDGAPGAGDMPGRLTFGTAADGTSSAVERMRIDNAGRVGIGTTSPTDVLYVSSSSTSFSGATLQNTDAVSTSSATQLTLKNDASDSFLLKIYSSQNPSTGARGPGRGLIEGTAAQGIGLAATNATGEIRFFTAGSANANERMRITDTGNVGIGVTAPGAKLEVAGQIKITGGTPGAGKVLTSDAAGLATWETPSSAAALGGDLSGNLPNPTVVKIQTRAVASTAPSDGQVLLWDNGNTTWTPQYVRMQDIRNAWGGTQMIPSTACAANQSMIWSVVTDRFTCQNIGSLNASTITAGTIATARLGSGTADNTTYLRGDGTWSTVSVTESDPKVGANTTDYLSKWNGSALVASAVYENSGNVGIGTTSPSYSLDVVKSQNAATTVRIVNSNAGASAKAEYGLENGTKYGVLGLAGTAYAGYGAISASNSYILSDGGISLGADTASGVIKFGTGAGITERMRINASGNVGIGTASPGSPLHIYSGSGLIMQTIESQNDSNDPQLALQRSRDNAGAAEVIVTDDFLGSILFRGFNGASQSTAARIGAIASENWSGGARGTHLVFYTNQNSTSTMAEKMRLTSAGNLGLGTTVPGANIHVADTTSSGAPMIRVSGSGGSIAANIGDSSASAGIESGFMSLGYEGTTKAYINANGITYFNGGDLGIGQTNPTMRLEVYDNVASDFTAMISNASATGNGLYVNAGPTSGTGTIPLQVTSYDGSVNHFYVNSDGGYYFRGSAISTKESKRDIASFDENAQSLLENIQVVKYRYKIDADERAERIGFLANDDNHVYDDRLTNNKRGFATDTIVGVMIKAFQEVYQKIEHMVSEMTSQSKRIDKLEAENAELKARLDRLEKAMVESQWQK